MKQLHFMALLLVAAMGLLVAGCSEDDGLYITRDEIIQGDILTGRQVGLPDNTLKVYTTEQGTVNVQGANGSITASVSDGKVAQVTCDNGKEKHVTVQGLTPGKAIVTVSDASGQTTTFGVEVTDVEQAWPTRTILTAVGPVECTVEGATPADSQAIALDAQKRFAGLKYAIQARTFYPTEFYRMLIYGADDALQEKHFLAWKHTKDGDATVFQCVLYDTNAESPLEKLSLSQEKGIERHVERYYQDRYPGLTKVVVRMAAKWHEVHR